MVEYFDVNKMKAMGQRIKISRKEKMLTQSKLAEELGISVDQMSNIENGKSACKPDYIFRLVRILGISSDYLFFGEDVLSRNDNIKAISKYSAMKKFNVLLSEADEYEKDKIYRIISIMLEKRTI